MQRRHGSARAFLPFVLLAALLFAFLLPRTAHAYAWMIRHGYTACGRCHADPSGGGLLTDYGRAQGDSVLRSHYGAAKVDAERPASAGFAWGAVNPPEWLLLGGAARSLVYVSKSTDGDARARFILMQADLRAGLKPESIGLRAAVSLGYVREGAYAARLAGSSDNHLVSREHWIGWAFDRDKWLVRAGRINLPFGIRTVEHTQFVRFSTRTDINAAQQHGIAVAYVAGKVRAEVMGIAGNYQLRPDSFRERGWSGYFEWAFTRKLALGVSSLATWANHDVLTAVETRRMADGLFARWAPTESLVLMVEADALFDSRAGDARTGGAGLLQADWQVWPGLHLGATGEVLREARRNAANELGAWATAWWFLLPHVDLRIDGIYRTSSTGTHRFDTTMALLQLHAYL